MSRSSTREERAQTDPLPALLAITVFAGALALYGGYVTDVLASSGGERDLSDAALEQAYHHVTEDGIHDPADSATALDSALPTAAIPEGRHVRVSITRIDVASGSRILVDDATYAPDGSTVGGDAPADADVAERPVAVKIDDGNVTGGTLRVEVWN